MTSRVERLRAALELPLLVTDRVNVRYLTGLRSSNAAALVDPGRVLVFADFRYADAGRALEHVEFVEVGRDLLGGLAPHLPPRVAFEADDLTFAGWETLRGGGLELVPTRGVVRGLRDVKDEDELAAIRRAAAVTDRAFERLADERFSGRSERELAWRLRELLHEEGAEDAAFPIIVAGGANGARPHTTPGAGVLEAGQTVVVDAGAVVDGYCSDCTRTFAVGELSERLRRAYDVCLEAQLAGLAAVRAGVTGSEADAAARGTIDGSEFAGTFGHGLGHGVGMDLHEGPVLRPESADVLAAGNVVSVEPGIYLPGEAGIRIEDLVAVTDDGCDVLSRVGKELVTVA